VALLCRDSGNEPLRNLSMMASVVKAGVTVRVGFLKFFQWLCLASKETSLQ